MRTGIKGCTAAIYTKLIREKAAERNLDEDRLLRGDLTFPYVSARWAVWRELRSRNFSFGSIGKVSGFDHTTVRNAILREGEPERSGTPKYPWNSLKVGCSFVVIAPRNTLAANICHRRKTYGLDYRLESTPKGMQVTRVA